MELDYVAVFGSFKVQITLMRLNLNSNLNNLSKYKMLAKMHLIH